MCVRRKILFFTCFCVFLSFDRAWAVLERVDFKYQKLWVDEEYYDKGYYGEDYVRWDLICSSKPCCGKSGFENFPTRQYEKTILQKEQIAIEKYLQNYVYSYEGKNYGMGVQYYIASEYSEHGYKFCNFYLSGKEGRFNTVEVWESTVPGWKKDCFWLCKPGYYSDGAGCNSTTMKDVSEPDMSVHEARRALANGSIQPIQEIGFRGKKIDGFRALDFNVNNMPGFELDVTNLCWGSKYMSRDEDYSGAFFLALKEVKTEGSTVTYTVQPLYVRSAPVVPTAGGIGLSDGIALPMAEFAGKTDDTMCPGNFVHKSGGGCFAKTGDSLADSGVSVEDVQSYEVQSVMAEQQENLGQKILCKGWSIDKYDANIHILKAAEGDYAVYKDCPTDGCTEGWKFDGFSKTCTVFVCKNGMGYKFNPMGSGDFSCVNCDSFASETISVLRVGLDAGGVCKICDLGEFFDNGLCKEGNRLHKSIMAGIYDKNSDEPKKLSDQCWTKIVPQEYKDCIEGEDADE